MRTSKFARQQGNAGVFVGVRPLRGARERKLGRRGATNPNDPYYWWFVEFGTSKMPGTPFMRTAFNQKAVVATYAIEQKLAERVELEAAKLARP